jgi:hypothetical protein
MSHDDTLGPHRRDLDGFGRPAGGRPAELLRRHGGRARQADAARRHRDAPSVKDGNWTDPAVWDAGTVPGDGARVRIDHQVTYNSTSTAKLDSVSVNGTLRLTTTPSVMWVDTLTGMGVLDGGTAQSPAKAEFIFLRRRRPAPRPASA